MKLLVAFLLTFIFFLFIFNLNGARAQTMSNTQFKLKMGNLDSIAGNSSSSQYKLNETSGGDIYGQYSGTNYKVKAGFQYVRVKIPFSFTISQNLIDFGTLTPTNPVTRTTNLTVSSNSSGFKVTASENQSLKSSNSTIPDTSCDNGDCTTLKSAQWLGTLTYGFGYRCDDLSGTNCPSDFSALNASSFYRPFPLSPATQTIISSAKGGTSRKSQITYKVNVSAAQPNGTYTNVVTYIASPGF